MIRAGTAGLLEPLQELFPGAMKPNACIVRCNPFFAGHFGHGRSLEIHPTEDAPIGWLQRGNQLSDALTDDLPHRVEQLTIFGVLDVRLTFERTRFAAPSSMVVDNAVPQQAIEPGDGALFVSNAVGLLEPLYECALENLFSDLTTLDPRNQKA